MINIVVNGTEIYGKLDTKLTSGSVGRDVKFVFDSSWDGLLKTAVFKVGDDSKDWYLGEGDECKFPWELLTHNKVGQPASIGVCGMRGEDIVYPTIYTYIGELAQGASTSDDPSIPPTPELVQQFINLVEESKKIAQSVRDDADNGVFDGDAANTDQVFDAESENAQSGVAISNYFASKIVNIADVVDLSTCEIGIYLTSILEYPHKDGLIERLVSHNASFLLVTPQLYVGKHFVWFKPDEIIEGVFSLNGTVIYPSTITKDNQRQIVSAKMVYDYVNETKLEIMGDVNEISALVGGAE